MPRFEPPIKRRQRDTSKAFTREQVSDLRRRYREGETMPALAKEFGVTIPTISRALYGLGAYVSD